MNFTEALDFINEKNKLGIVPGLENIKELLRRLGNPQNKCKCLHIGGTNGKGSIFSYVEDILIEAGYEIGRYISPTIFTYLERFQINKELMSEEDFARLAGIVADTVDSMVKDGFVSPTAFEIETAIAFLYFFENDVDFALIECGMGGELDGTNVIDNTLISVLASISRDHMQYLGNTIEEITKHKVGIVKESSACVSYPQVEAAEEIIREDCKEKNTKLYYVEKSDIKILKASVEETCFLYKGEEYAITMLGDHQVLNAVTAIEVMDALNDVGYYVSKECILKGLKGMCWPGRLSKVANPGGPDIFVDGAHNEDAWILLKDTLNKYFTNDKFIYIIGVLGDKEYSKMVDILSDTMKAAVVITPANKRGLDKAILAKLIEERDIYTVTADNQVEAKRLANSLSEDGDVIIVCGSLSFLSDYLN